MPHRRVSHSDYDQFLNFKEHIRVWMITQGREYMRLQRDRVRRKRIVQDAVDFLLRDAPSFIETDVPDPGAPLQRHADDYERGTPKFTAHILVGSLSLNVAIEIFRTNLEVSITIYGSVLYLHATSTPRSAMNPTCIFSIGWVDGRPGYQEIGNHTLYELSPSRLFQLTSEIEDTMRLFPSLTGLWRYVDLLNTSSNWTSNSNSNRSSNRSSNWNSNWNSNWMSNTNNRAATSPIRSPNGLRHFRFPKAKINLRNRLPLSWVNPVTFKRVPPKHAYYLKPDVYKNTITAVYNHTTLSQLLKLGGGKSVSPLTRKPFTVNDIYKVVTPEQRLGLHILKQAAVKEMARSTRKRRQPLRLSNTNKRAKK